MPPIHTLPAHQSQPHSYHKCRLSNTAANPPVVELSILVQISALEYEADIPLRQVQAALLVQALHGVEEFAKVYRLIPI